MAALVSNTGQDLGAGALAVRQTRERYKQRGLRQINAMLDEAHSAMFAELLGGCSGYATKRTIQEAVSLLHKVKIGQAVIIEK